MHGRVQGPHGDLSGDARHGNHRPHHHGRRRRHQYQRSGDQGRYLEPASFRFAESEGRCDQFGRSEQRHHRLVGNRKDRFMAISATAGKKETQFLWEGKDKRGNKVRGKSLAANEQALRADLRRQGVAPTRVKTQSKAFRSGGKVTNEDIAVFSRQLATMMSAGIPMVQAFEIIGNGHEKPAMQKLVLDIKANIEGGSTLHESLAKFPLHFDNLFVNLVEAGEQAGALESLLDKIATYKEKTEALKKKIKKALFYPIAVLGVAVIVR